MLRSARRRRVAALLPFAGTTLESGEVVAVENLDGARLQSVDKGVVRSFATSVEITEIGSAEQVGAETAAYRTEGDARLVVFSLTAERNDRETPLEGEVVPAIGAATIAVTLPKN